MYRHCWVLIEAWMGYTVFCIFETVMVTHGRMCELDFSNLAGIGDDGVMLVSYNIYGCSLMCESGHTHTHTLILPFALPWLLYHFFYFYFNLLLLLPHFFPYNIRSTCMVFNFVLKPYRPIIINGCFKTAHVN